MPERKRFVADTNTLVSRLLAAGSVPSTAFRHALASMQLISCRETLLELEGVLQRTKFDRYLSVHDRNSFLTQLRRQTLLIEAVPPLQVCRDPKDDKFLALASAGKAGLILSGDHDLLVLHPFGDIKIFSPRQYLDLHFSSRP